MSTTQKLEMAVDALRQLGATPAARTGIISTQLRSLSAQCLGAFIGMFSNTVFMLNYTYPRIRWTCSGHIFTVVLGFARAVAMLKRVLATRGVVCPSVTLLYGVETNEHRSIRLSPSI